MLRVSDNDQDKTTLAEELCARLLPQFDTYCIARTAYNPETYYYLCAAACTCPRKPKLVIMPINLRSFSPQWALQPKWQFPAEIAVAERFLANPGPSLPRMPPVPRPDDTAMQAFRSTPVRYRGTDFSRIADFAKAISKRPKSENELVERKRILFIYHYMYVLDGDSAIFRRLADTADLLTSRGIGVILYFTPINFSAGLRYVGVEFAAAVEANKALILSSLGMKPSPTSACDYTGCRHSIVADWSALLGPEHFFHEADPTEHLNCSGRAKLAAKLTDLATRFAAQRKYNSE